MTQVFDEQQIAMLDAPLDQRLISARSGGGSSSLKYIEGHDAIDQADRIFGYGNWAYRPLSCEQTVLIDPVDGTPLGVTYKARVELVVAGAIAPIVEVGSQPVASWNVADVLANNHKGPTPIEEWERVKARRTIVDAHEMAEKGSVTDALKRCLRAYGNQFGNGLYGDGRVDLDEPQPQQRQQSQQSAPRQQQQSAKAAPAPQDDAPATEQQLNAIRKLYTLGLKQEVPADVDGLKFSAAKDRIKEISAAVVEAKKATQSRQNDQQSVASGQPEVQNAVPTQNVSEASQTQSKPSEIDTIKSRWFKAYHIKDDDQIEIRWAAFKVSIFNGMIEDASLKQGHLARLNGTVEAHERKQQRTH